MTQFNYVNFLFYRIMRAAVIFLVMIKTLAVSVVYSGFTTGRCRSSYVMLIMVKLHPSSLPVKMCRISAKPCNDYVTVYEHPRISYSGAVRISVHEAPQRTSVLTGLSNRQLRHFVNADGQTVSSAWRVTDDDSQTTVRFFEHAACYPSAKGHNHALVAALRTPSADCK